MTTDNDKSVSRRTFSSTTAAGAAATLESAPTLSQTITASSESKIAKTNFDYLLIGGRTASSVLAAHLSESPDTSVLIRNWSEKQRRDLRIRRRCRRHVDTNNQKSVESRRCGNAIKGLRLALAQVGTKALSPLTYISTLTVSVDAKNAQREAHIRNTGESIYHPAGSVRMGADGDDTAALDAQSRVKGIGACFRTHDGASNSCCRTRGSFYQKFAQAVSAPSGKTAYAYTLTTNKYRLTVEGNTE